MLDTPNSSPAIVLVNSRATLQPQPAPNMLVHYVQKALFLDEEAYKHDQYLHSEVVLSRQLLLSLLSNSMSRTSVIQINKQTIALVLNLLQFGQDHPYFIPNTTNCYTALSE